MNKITQILLTIPALAGLGATPSIADEHWHDGWNGGYHHAHHYDRDHWREGHWLHGWHENHLGWWWVVGPSWYFFPAPIYPYPEPPVVVVTPPAQVPPQYAYYCPNPPGYYPALPQCPTGWQMIPVGPAPVAPPPPAAMPVPAPAPAPSGGLDKAMGGTILGAIGGGIAGTQFGHGSGKLAATAAGTLLGAFVGREIGTSLDHADQLAAERAEHTAYGAPLGQTIAWNNPDSGHSGTITPLRDGQDSRGEYCREFQQTVVIGNKTEQAHGTACRQPDGAWKLVSQ